MAIDIFQPHEIAALHPMYNEAERIEKCVKSVEGAITSFSSSYEIVISEDGSNDSTDHVADSVARRSPRVRHLHSPTRLGKGGAINCALRAAKADIIMFLDADLATNLRHLQPLIVAIKWKRGLTISSRFAQESEVKRPIHEAWVMLIALLKFSLEMAYRNVRN